MVAVLSLYLGMVLGAVGGLIYGETFTTTQTAQGICVLAGAADGWLIALFYEWRRQ